MTHTAIFAHRGVSSQYPENTMIAFQAAADLGIEGIELDVQLSKERVPVVIHDLTVNRTTNGKGFIKDYTVAELKELSAGGKFAQSYDQEEIPTLAEVLEFAHTNDLLLNIELKGYIWERQEMLDSVLPLLEESRLGKRLIISSFDHKGLRLLRERSPEIETALLVTGALDRPELYVKQAGAQGYHYHTPLMLKEEAQQVMHAGIELRPYTVNDKEWLRRYMEWSISGVITDYPQVALEIRRQLENNG